MTNWKNGVTCYQIVTLCFGISAVKWWDSPWIAANAGVAERPPESPGAAAGVGVDALPPVSAGGGALVGGLGGGGSHVLGGGLDEGEGAAWFFGLGYSWVRRFGYWRVPFDWNGNDHWEKSMFWNSHLKDGKPFIEIKSLVLLKQCYQNTMHNLLNYIPNKLRQQIMLIRIYIIYKICHILWSTQK